MERCERLQNHEVCCCEMCHLYDECATAPRPDEDRDSTVCHTAPDGKPFFWYNAGYNIPDECSFYK